MTRPIIALFVLLLAGCAASAQTRSAYVDINALVRQHPLYGTLAQYDRQIAAVESTLHTRFSNADAQFTKATNAIRRDADGTAAAYNAAVDINVKSGHRILCCHAEPLEAGANIESQIQSTYEQQHAELQSTAQTDMAQYRTALQAQERAAYASFVDAMTERAQRAVDLRAQELHEHESNLLLELARKHASQRLMLRAKLQTLVLRDETRKQYLAQLTMLQAQEYKALNAARRADAATLNAYKAQVEAQAQSDLTKMQSDLASRTAANLAAREHVLQSQTSGSSTLALPAAPRSTGSPADMQTAYDSLTSSKLADDSAFGTARNDIASNFTALRQANDDDTAHTRSQIDWLRHDREAVRKRIIAQILFEASRIAKSKGYDNVTPGHAPSGSPDITSSVAADLRTLSP